MEAMGLQRPSPKNGRKRNDRIRGDVGKWKLSIIYRCAIEGAAVYIVDNLSCSGIPAVVMIWEKFTFLESAGRFFQRIH